ncbi:MAG: cyclic nucleotide-binding domain-containing protein [Candidatus Wallbacteria bacterium]|nr:cyclic nucleotide-binding domain-containing protein [Candidatus Wallbacteria bacterium]
MRDSIFEDLSEHELEEILKFTEEVTLPPSSVIFKQDSAGDSLYIIKKGTASLVKKNELGEEFSMGTAEPGMFLGELAILDGGRQPFTATSTTEIVVLRITRDKLDLLYKVNKKILCKFYLSLIRYVNFRLRKANEGFAASRSSMQKL